MCLWGWASRVVAEGGGLQGHGLQSPVDVVQQVPYPVRDGVSYARNA